jgi:hypothetical protein
LILFSIKSGQKDAFSYLPAGWLAAVLLRKALNLPAETAALFQRFPIGLSRACLGKVIVF